MLRLLRLKTRTKMRARPPTICFKKAHNGKEAEIKIKVQKNYEKKHYVWTNRETCNVKVRMLRCIHKHPPLIGMISQEPSMGLFSHF